MPNYEFLCESCHETHELDLRIKEYMKRPRRQCPKCGLDMVRYYAPTMSVYKADGFTKKVRRFKI